MLAAGLFGNREVLFFSFLKFLFICECYVNGTTFRKIGYCSKNVRTRTGGGSVPQGIFSVGFANLLPIARPFPVKSCVNTARRRQNVNEQLKITIVTY